MWLKQCHLHHPPVITSFIGGMLTIPSHGWLMIHCFTHMISHYIPVCIFLSNCIPTINSSHYISLNHITPYRYLYYILIFDAPCSEIRCTWNTFWATSVSTFWWNVAARRCCSARRSSRFNVTATARWDEEKILHKWRETVRNVI